MTICAALFFASCTVNKVNQPNVSNSQTSPASSSSPANASTATDETPHWSVVVCSSRAKTVTLSAGASERDGEIFGTWRDSGVQRQFFLPLNLQKSARVYIKASASDKNQVEMCVLYDGKAKKRVEFDDDEDVNVAADDTDELDKCRCTS